MNNAELKKSVEDAAAERGLTAMPKVLLAASEAAPLAKTGGLADVVGTLPKYLRRFDIDARIMIPYHQIIREKYGDQISLVKSFTINVGSMTKPVDIYQMELDGVTIWLIGSEEYFSGPIYMPEREGEQYAYFTRAVLASLPQLNFIPDVIHCNDWHTGMIPLLLKTQYIDSELARTKTLMTIHNIAYQGLCGFDFVQNYLYVPDGCFGLIERYGMASFMKAGCVMADRVNTVSPSYAREICTPEYGEGLEQVLSLRGDVCGICNGIDKNVWNPARDPNILKPFSRTRLIGKMQNKLALMEELGLEIMPNRPLIGMVTRLAEQKGVTLMMDVMDQLLNSRDFAFVLLGNGNADYENWFRGLEARHKGRVCSYIGYSDALSHRIYAGCDFFLMPSLFEPCGISQLISMAYGTLPIVRETGGLKDTVIPYNRYTGEGTGFSFSRRDGYDMMGAVNYALDAYNDKQAMAKLIDNAMSQDCSCEAWAADYAKLYIDIL